jgi:hypothetical protein
MGNNTATPEGFAADPFKLLLAHDNKLITEMQHRSIETFLTKTYVINGGHQRVRIFFTQIDQTRISLHVTAKQCLWYQHILQRGTQGNSTTYELKPLD